MDRLLLEEKGLHLSDDSDNDNDYSESGEEIERTDEDTSGGYGDSASYT